MPDINNVRTINELERKQTVLDSDAFAVSNESGTFSATAAQIRDNTLSGGGIAPVGSIIGWTGSQPPTGWLLCDGSSISQEDYAKLYECIGYKQVPLTELYSKPSGELANELQYNTDTYIIAPSVASQYYTSTISTSTEFTWYIPFNYRESASNTPILEAGTAANQKSIRITMNAAKMTVMASSGATTSWNLLSQAISTKDFVFGKWYCLKIEYAEKQLTVSVAECPAPVKYGEIETFDQMELEYEQLGQWTFANDLLLEAPLMLGGSSYDTTIWAGQIDISRVYPSQIQQNELTTFRLPNLVGGYIMGADKFGEVISESVPNLRGSFYPRQNLFNADGVLFTALAAGTNVHAASVSSGISEIIFDASRVSAAYVDGAKVRPDSVGCQYIIKI